MTPAVACWTRVFLTPPPLSQHTIRALALRVLKEILRNQPARFKNYAELTIMKTLEAHKDSHKEVGTCVREAGEGGGRGMADPADAAVNCRPQVVRAAEEAASTLAGSIHPEQCIKVLCPIVQTADYPINLAAIKMQTKAIERIAKEPLHQLLSDIIPGLLQVRFLLRTFRTSLIIVIATILMVSFSGLRQH